MGCETSTQIIKDDDFMYLSTDGTKNKEKMLKVNPKKMSFFVRGIGSDGFQQVLEMTGELCRNDEGKYILMPKTVKDKGKEYQFQN